MSVATLVSPNSNTGRSQITIKGFEPFYDHRNRSELEGGVQLEELHSEVDAVRVATRDLEIARPRRSCGDDSGIVGLADLLSVNVYANMRVVDERL